MGTFSWLPNPITSVAWLVLGIVVWIVRGSLDQPELWRTASALQGLSFLPLLWRALFARTVSSISVKKLSLDVVCLICRLIASYMLDLKLPRKSAHSFVMAVDALSLTACLFLLVCALGWRRGTYQRQSDSFPMLPMLGILPLAAVLPATIGKRFLPDFLWTLALYVDGLAMMPQLWLIAQNAGVVDVAVAHHIAGMFGSRLLAVNFWWLIRGHWLQGTRYCGWLILITCTVQLLLLTHFMCYYLKTLCTRGPLSTAPLLR